MLATFPVNVFCYLNLKKDSNNKKQQSKKQQSNYKGKYLKENLLNTKQRRDRVGHKNKYTIVGQTIYTHFQIVIANFSILILSFKGVIFLV